MFYNLKNFSPRTAELMRNPEFRGSGPLPETQLLRTLWNIKNPNWTQELKTWAGCIGDRAELSVMGMIKLLFGGDCFYAKGTKSLNKTI